LHQESGCKKVTPRQTIIRSHPFDGKNKGPKYHNLLGNLTHQTMRGFTRNCPIQRNNSSRSSTSPEEFMTQTMRVVQMPLPYVFLDDAW